MLVERQNVKFKDADFDYMMKQNAANWFDLGVQANASGDLYKAFQYYKQLFNMLATNPVNNREAISNQIILLDDYFESLKGGRVPNRRDLIVLKNKKQLEVRFLLDGLMVEIPKAFEEAGLWFSYKTVSSDFSVLLSDENFNDEFSDVGKKARYLLTFPVEKLVSNLTKNQVHELFAKLMLEQAVSDGLVSKPVLSEDKGLNLNDGG